MTYPETNKADPATPRTGVVIPFRPTSQTSGPAFDPILINQHVALLFDLARGMEGKFVACALTGDKTDPPYAIRHFRSDGGANEMEQMAYFIRSFCPSFGVHPDRVVREPWTAPNGKVKTYPSDCRCKSYGGFSVTA
jgi:hypothetical protein